MIEFILPFAYSIAGSAGTRTNSRAIFEQTLSSCAATDRKSTARLECGLASSAAIAGSAGTRTNSRAIFRAIFEQTLSSHAATDRESTARLERGLASSAAGGVSAPRKFAPGELQKKRRHVDAQERMDELIGGMANEAGLMADAIKSITGVSAESPGRKKQRQLTSITANIKLL